MRRALELARKAGEETRPNPRVGGGGGERGKVARGRFPSKGWRTSCGSHGVAKGWSEGKRSGSLCDLRAVFDPWKDASLYRPDRGVRDSQGDLWIGGCGSEKCGQSESNSAKGGDSGSAGCNGGGV